MAMRRARNTSRSGHRSASRTWAPSAQMSASAACAASPAIPISSETMLLRCGIRLHQPASRPPGRKRGLTTQKPAWLSRPHVATPHRHRPPAFEPGLRRGIAACTRAYYRTHRCGTSWRVIEKSQIRSKTPHRPRCGVFRFQHPFHLKPCIRTTLPPPNTPAAAPQARQWHAWSALPIRPPRPDATAVFLTARFLSSQGTQAS